MPKEEVKRLAPTFETLRELFLRSGNQCAFPGCHRLLMNDSGDFIGQVCHIEAASEKGERFNPKQSNEDRRLGGNLLLMCYDHHVVTNDVDAYPVLRMQQIKADHERKYGDVALKMRNSIADFTEISEVRVPRNLLKLNEILGWGLSVEDLSETIPELEEFAQRLSSLPIATRELLAIIYKRGKILDGFRKNVLGISLSELKHCCDLDSGILKEHIEILDRYGFVTEGYKEDFMGLEGVEIPPLKSGWPIGPDLQKFCTQSGIGIDGIIVDLGFNCLDNPSF